MTKSYAEDVTDPWCSEELEKKENTEKNIVYEEKTEKEKNMLHEEKKENTENYIVNEENTKNQNDDNDHKESFTEDKQKDTSKSDCQP